MIRESDVCQIVVRSTATMNYLEEHERLLSNFNSNERGSISCEKKCKMHRISEMSYFINNIQTRRDAKVSPGRDFHLSEMSNNLIIS